VGTKFRTLLAPIGASTGDGRRLAEGGISLAETPFPFTWVRASEGGHDGAVVVGAVQSANVGTVAEAVANGWIGAEQVSGMYPGASGVWATGELFDNVDRETMPRLAEDVAEAMHLIEAGTLGPSVDLDSFEGVPVLAGSDTPITEALYAAHFEATGQEPKLELLVTSGRVRAATLVSIPAFAETSRPLELMTEDALTASVTGSTSLPVADTGHAWDGPGATRRVFAHFTDGDTVDTAGIAKAFLYRDPDADASTQAAYKLGFADVIDGTLTIIPRGVAAVTGGRGVDATTGIPDAEKARIRSKVCSLYGKIRSAHEDWPECPFTRSEAASEASALVASVAAVERVTAAAFDGHKLTGPTPITYDIETGRVFGHIATWRTCHVGYSDVCVTAPKSTDGYASFNRFPVETADGVVWAGRITVGGRHAGLSLSASGAISEYDSKTIAAYVRAYEDEHGIAVSGVMQPGLTDEELQTLARRKVSGDWRETSAGLSLVEVLALSPGPRAHSEPGFPVETFSRAGRQVALVASLSPDPETPATSPVPTLREFQLTDEQLDVFADSVASKMAERKARAELSEMIRAGARSSLAAVLKGA